MIRYADESDLELLESLDTHISKQELKNSIDANKVFVMLHNEKLIGWLRFNLFWDSIPFMNMLYILEGYRGNGCGRQLVTHWEKEMLDCGSLLLPDEPLEIILMKNLA